jgi:tetratricopeptide (TPR) repeat protein
MDESLYRSWLLMNSRRFEQSEQQIREHLSQNPDDPEAHITLAICLCDLSRHHEAIDSARKALSLTPDNAYFHWVLGALYLRSQQFDLAEAPILEAIKINPHYPDFYGSLAELYWRQGQSFRGLSKPQRTEVCTRGINAANQGLRIDGEHHNCYVYLVRNLLLLDDRTYVPQAIDAAQKLLSLAPQSSEAHEVYAQALSCQLNGKPNQHQVEQILSIINESLRLDPNSPYPKVLADYVLTHYYQSSYSLAYIIPRNLSRWIMLSALPLLILTFYCYGIWGLQNYLTLVPLTVSSIGILIMVELSYIKIRVSQHPQARSFLTLDPFIKKFWGAFAVIVAVRMVWQFLPLFLTNLITFILWLFFITLGFALVMLLLRKVSPIFTWISQIEKNGNKLQDRIADAIARLPGSRFINSKSWANGCVLTMGGCGFFIAVFVIIAVVTLIYPIIKSIK